MEMNYTQITWLVGDALLPAVITDGELWFTQKTIGSLLGVTTQALAYHLREWVYNNLSAGTKEFSVPKNEGTRVVSRRLKHYPLATIYSIANVTRKMDCIMPVIELANRYKVTVNETFVTVRKERQFHELLMGLLSGIVEIKPQYRIRGYIIDFYIPEMNLGIEYDEYPHQQEKRKEQDILRQNKLQQAIGVRFIRIQQGAEIEGLNEIIKLLIVNCMSRLFTKGS